MHPSLSYTVLSAHPFQMRSLIYFFSCLFIGDNKLIEVFLIESDFYNWNRVKIRYCDGASFAGNAKFDNGVILFHLKFRF